MIGGVGNWSAGGTLACSDLIDDDAIVVVEYFKLLGFDGFKWVLITWLKIGREEEWKGVEVWWRLKREVE